MLNKKKLYVLVFTLIMMTGCANVDSYLQTKMQEKAGISEEATYKQYQEFETTGHLDVSGNYTNSASSDNAYEGYVHVSLGYNKKNLDITYYRDEEHTSQILEDDIYMAPGESLFASVDVVNDIYTSTYEFKEFRIYQWDSENDKKETSITSDFNESGVVLHIPEDFKQSDLSIEPIGMYKERQVFFNDYLVDDKNHEEELPGKWIINDREYEGVSANISPIAPYIISYEYDSNEYYFVSSSPECFYSNNDDGVVVFKQKEASERDDEYVVKLYKYVDISIVSDKDRSVTYNGETKNYKSNTKVLFSKLKYGDHITIETDKEWKDLANNRDIILTNTEDLSDKYRYTLVVPEKGAEFIFDPSEYKYEHGKIKFTCFGSEVNDIQYLARESKIYYEAEPGTVEDGYWLPEGEHCIVVSDSETTKKDLNSIHFMEMVKVNVSLPQPKCGGKINYTVDGKKVTSADFSTYSGTVIDMDFEEWEGWKCNCKDGDTYVVDDNSKQVVNANGVDINNVFVEDDEHKPKLTVVLDKSVGESMEFYITASGETPDEQKNKYVGAWYRSDYKLIDAVKIGTECGIELSMSNKAIPSGKAVRVLITKEDTAKKRTVEKRYIVDLSKLNEPINIYELSEMGKSKVWYKTITINVAIVDIEIFKSPAIGANTTLTVWNPNDLNQIYHNGDYIEPSEKVGLIIRPTAGYYVSGKGTFNDCYQGEMKYSDFMKKMDGIIADHSAKKIYSLTLDTSDQYANYTYKLDGKVVSGTISVRDGQKLELTYEITDSNYKLSQKAGGVIGIGASDKKVSHSIKIDSSCDGKVISKSSFNISTVKGEQ